MKQHLHLADGSPSKWESSTFGQARLASHPPTWRRGHGALLFGVYRLCHKHLWRLQILMGGLEESRGKQEACRGF